MRHYYPILSIAGSDSSGGAGVQADIKTISAIGGYAMTAITALTAQSTTGVTKILNIGSDMLEEQIMTTCNDIRPLAVKTGMIPDKKGIETVADCIRKLNLRNIVVDPVMISTSGSRLMEEGTLEILKKRLLPLATIVTPNIDEAIAMTGTEIPEEQASVLHKLGCRVVLLKGGDSDRKDIKVDYLSIENRPLTILKADAVNTKNTHGTGCTLSAAIATYLGLGYEVEDAVMRGKLFVTRAIESGSFITTGRGNGPVNHFFSPRRLKSYNPNRRYED